MDDLPRQAVGERQRAAAATAAATTGHGDGKQQQAGDYPTKTQDHVQDRGIRKAASRGRTRQKSLVSLKGQQRDVKIRIPFQYSFLSTSATSPSSPSLSCRSPSPQVNQQFTGSFGVRRRIGQTVCLSRREA